MTKKLAILTTHPIQYNAPLFELLSGRKNISVRVFYSWGESVVTGKYDPGFGKAIDWDIPLLEGYEYEFLENTAKEKGSHHFNGIINPGIITRITAWQPDAILVYGWAFSSHLRVMRHFKNKIPVLFRGDSTLLDEKKNIAGFIKKQFIQWVYRHIDTAFYCGTNNKKYFEYYGLRPAQLIPAFHAIDNKRFDNSDGRYDAPASSMKNQLGIKEGDKVFLYAGKLVHGKNVASLIQAFQKITTGNVHLVIAGNGPEEDILKKYFAGTANLHFIDFQNQQQMPALYHVCDVFVLPSNAETWGLSVNEAMAAGRAILISDKCGCAIDLVIDNKNGYIFKTGVAENLYEKMEKCIDDPVSLRQMQLNSTRRISDFTFEHIAAAVEKKVNFYV
jgi:glycosyltransferase involved in cell wall biosynthesis